MTDREVSADGPPTVVSAVAAMTGHGTTIEAAERNAVIQAAMVAAIEKAQAEGVVDPDAIRERILAARDAAQGE